MNESEHAGTSTKTRAQRHKERNGTADRNDRPNTMILFYITIPVMLLAVAIATIPLLHAMRVEARIDRELARTAGWHPEVAEETPLAA